MKSIIFGDHPVSFLDSIYITVVSMTIVFAVLVIISVVLYFMKYIPSDEKEAKGKEQKNAGGSSPANTVLQSAQGSIETSQKIDYEDEFVRLAIMVASMEAAAEDENAYIRVRSVKQIA